MSKQIIESVVSGGYTFGKDKSNNGFFVFRCDKTDNWFTCDVKEAKFLGIALREVLGSCVSYVSFDKRIKIEITKFESEIVLCHTVGNDSVEFNLAEDESIALGEAIYKRMSSIVVGR